jgi:hypothetical protein
LAGWETLTSESETETNQEPGTDEHADRLGGCLDHGCDTHDDSTDEDRGTTTKSIGDVWGEWVGGEGTNVLGEESIQLQATDWIDSLYLDGVQETKRGTRWPAKVVSPFRDRLQTVHHTTIVTVC